LLSYSSRAVGNRMQILLVQLLILYKNKSSQSTNQKTIDWLSSHTGSVGIIYMDFAGMDESPDCASAKLYKTVGMKLVDAVIKQNF